MQGRRNRERGGSRTNLVFTLLVLGVMVYTGIKVIPPYVSNYQFQDSIESEARFAIAGYPRKSDDEIRQDVWKKAQELSIPIAKAEDIKVVTDRANVSIATDYIVPVDLIIYQFNMEFHPHADNHTI